MSESKASLWLSLAVVFAGLVASWVTLREQTGNHEKVLTSYGADIREMQRDNRLSDRQRAMELNIEALTQQVSYLRDEIRELKKDRKR